MRKLRHSKVKWSSQGQAAWKWQSQDLNSRNLVLRALEFSLNCYAKEVQTIGHTLALPTQGNKREIKVYGVIAGQAECGFVL